jgi:general secretion pathway protein G
MQNKANWRGREGFTLIEVLVTLILLAVLAAAVFPVVTQQTDQADPVRAATDLASLRSGIEAFRVDVRPDYPADLEDLIYALSNTTDDALDGQDYTNAEGWNGPYIDATQPLDDVAQVPTAFGANIQSELDCVDATDDTANGTCAEGDFVVLSITDLDADEAARLETQIDGANGALNTGKFRHAGTTGLYVVGPFF